MFDYICASYVRLRIDMIKPIDGFSINNFCAFAESVLKFGWGRVINIFTELLKKWSVRVSYHPNYEKVVRDTDHFCSPSLHSLWKLSYNRGIPGGTNLQQLYEIVETWVNTRYFDVPSQCEEFTTR